MCAACARPPAREWGLGSTPPASFPPAVPLWVVPYFLPSCLPLRPSSRDLLHAGPPWGGGLFPGQGDPWGEPGVARNRLSPCALAMPRAPPGTPACALPTRKSPVLSLPQGQCASFLSSLSGPRTSGARCPQPRNPSPPGWLPPPAV